MGLTRRAIDAGALDDALKALYGADALDAQRARYAGALNEFERAFGAGDVLFFSARGAARSAATTLTISSGACSKRSHARRHRRHYAARGRYDPPASTGYTPVTLIRSARSARARRPSGTPPRRSCAASRRGSPKRIASAGSAVDRIGHADRKPVILDAAFGLLIGTIFSGLYSDGEISH